MISKLLMFARSVWLDMALAIFLGTLTILSSIGLLGTSAYLITAAGFQPGIGPLQVAIVGVRFFGLSRAVFRYLERLQSHSVNLKLLANLRSWVFTHLVQKYPFKNSQRRNTALLASMTGDIDYLENFYVRFLSPILIAFFVSLLVVFFLGLYSLEVMLITLLGLLQSGLGIPWLAIHFSQMTRGAVNKSKAAYQDSVGDFIAGYQEMNLYFPAEKIIADLHNIEMQWAKNQKKQHKYQAALNSLGYLNMQGTVLVVIIVTALLIANQNLDAILLAVFSMITLASFEAVNGLPTAALLYEEIKVSAGNILSIETMPSANSEEEEIEPPLSLFPVRISNLNYRFDDIASPVLNQVTFEIKEGEKIAIVGDSGSGKSTLVDILAGLRRDYSGVILCGEKDFKSLPDQWIFQQVNSLASSPYLFSTSLKQNLMLSRETAKKEDMYNSLNLMDFSDDFLNRFFNEEQEINVFGSNLSAGEKQRIALAQSIIHGGNLFLFDEPLANIDPVLADEIMSKLFALLAKKTIFWVSHHFIQMERFDHIYLLDSGLIIQSGTHRSLIEKEGPYRQMYYAKLHEIGPNLSQKN